ncbi:MAG TPA: multiheme c-type cytochrome, partial [Vicinamibacteria bacterium]|nr:multiheme c-type cytochrome [Vicinamibacteria bacterium]
MSRLAVGFLVLLANSAYLAARSDPTVFYFANVVLHVALGAGLAVAAGRRLRGRRAAPLLKAAAPLLLLAALAGVTLLAVGATRPWRWLLWTHIGAACAGSALVLAWMARAGARAAAGQRGLRTAGVVLGAAALIGAAVGVPVRGGGPPRHHIANPAEPPASMEGEGAGPQAPFFPSSARTNVGGVIPANFFMTSQACGRCHREIYEQWNSSAHHFSSFNNQWYRKSIEYMQDVVGTRPSKWCAGCHDHAVFFNGRFDRPIKEQIQTPEAQAGLSCTSCHSIVHVNSTMGQGDFTIEYPPLHDVAVSDHPVLRWGHDFLLRADP